MSKDTQLPAEWKDKIEQEGQELLAFEPDNRWAYRKGATAYAIKLQAELQATEDKIDKALHAERNKMQKRFTESETEWAGKLHQAQQVWSKGQFDVFNKWLSEGGYSYDGEYYYDEENNFYTPDQLWERYSPTALVPQQVEVWVKAIDRLPGWNQAVRWRHETKEVLPGKYALCDITSPLPLLNGFEWLDESTCEKNNGCKGKEVETKKAKAWDEWRDSLVKHDNVLVHFKERPEKYTEAFTFEEFKIVMLNKSPVFFFNTMYSNDTPLYQITSQFMPSGVDYFATSWADKTPKRKTLEQFYKMLKLDGLENIRF